MLSSGIVNFCAAASGGGGDGKGDMYMRDALAVEVG